MNSVDPRGRRSKSEGPALPEQHIDTLLVHGELVVDEQGTKQHHFLSYRELAARFDVAHRLIGRFVNKHNYLERHQKARTNTEYMVQAKLIKLRAQSPNLNRDDLIRTAERYLVAFEEQLLCGEL